MANAQGPASAGLFAKVRTAFSMPIAQLSDTRKDRQSLTDRQLMLLKKSLMAGRSEFALVSPETTTATQDQAMPAPDAQRRTQAIQGGG